MRNLEAGQNENPWFIEDFNVDLTNQLARSLTIKIPLLKLKKEINNSEYEEVNEPNGTNRIKMKGMRSQDIATILTSANFNEFSQNSQSYQQKAPEEAG